MERQSLIGLAHYESKNDILVVNCPTVQNVNKTACEILEKYTDAKTALFLSGGTTPKNLYKEISTTRKIRPGAVLQIDERFGDKFHKNSNELMIKETGLLDYLGESNIRFYSMLEGKDLNDSAKDYDEALRFVFKYFPKSVGILGIGADGHTAGIPRNEKTVKEIIENQSSLVSFYELEKYGQRLTLNFSAISMLDLIIVLVLGQEKREMLSSLFKEPNGEEEILKFPAKFYLKPEIAKKTILLTDQIF